MCLPLVCCGGCGEESRQPELAEVRGTVTFNGRPVVAEVTFQPAGDDSAGRPSRGFSDSDGQFTLQYSADAEGAVPGRHEVVITVPSVEDPGAPAAGLGLQQAVKTARLVRTVEPGENEFHFALTY